MIGIWQSIWQSNGEAIVQAVGVGIGATVILDVFGMVRARMMKEPALDWAMFGRWLGHVVRGRFVHEAITASAPVPFERPLGWAFHYLVGIGLAIGFLGIVGAGWFAAPVLWPAFTYGLATVILPWVTTQPGLGMGIAASRLPNPWGARWRSVMTHAVFGLGLYHGALVWRAIPL
ncbi:DUF2938 domain-containing protein [Rhodobacteraceae bacterium D3-12]|nr:DUF2938 domain-containing protein [Rhodobacteraceae bacterium D3-12]